MCHANSQWSRTLSTVLLGLHSSVVNSGSSPAEFVYGTTLRIPGEFVLPDYESADPQIFLEEFREHIRQIKPVPVGHHCKRCVFVHKDLASCTHVYLRVTVSRRSLEQPYTGPHKVLDRISDRVFKIDVNGVPRNVSVENIKPTYFVPEYVSDNPSSSSHVSSRETTPALKTYLKKSVRFAPSTKE